MFKMVVGGCAGGGVGVVAVIVVVVVVAVVVIVIFFGVVVVAVIVARGAFVVAVIGPSAGDLVLAGYVDASIAVFIISSCVNLVIHILEVSRVFFGWRVYRGVQVEVSRVICRVRV